MRHSSVLIITLLAVLASSSTALAQNATPAPGPIASPLASSAADDRPDLAAMALTPADLPPGYLNVDERYFLSAQGVSTFFTGEATSPEEIDAISLKSMYDSFYDSGPGGDFLYLYIAEFASPEGVQAGFDILEDETRQPEGVEVVSTQDLPALGIGEAPSEITVSVVDYRSGGGPLVTSTAMSFRVDAFLVGVILETPIEEGTSGTAATPVTNADQTAATPVVDLRAEQLLTELADTLVERIESVQAGETVSDADSSLPPLLLSTDQAWPLPGLAAEGYKDASIVLGSLGPAAEFADAFQSAYARTVAPGTGPDDLFPEPPFATVGVSVFTSPDAAMSVLEEAGQLPVPGPLPSPQIWEQVERAETPESDASHAYRSAFQPGGPADSARVAFVSGNYLVTVDIQFAASEQVALAVAEDLAAQQAACLSTDGPCQDVTVPNALESGAAATPVAATPTG